MMVNSMTRSTSKQLILFKIFLILISLQGLIAFPFLWQIPSMQRNSSLFGFSSSRMSVLFLFGLVVLLILVFTCRVLFNHAWSKLVNTQIHSFLANPKYYWNLLIVNVLISVFGCLFLIAFNYYAGRLTTDLYGVIFFRMQPIIAWLTCVSMEISFYLFFAVYKTNPVLRDRFLFITILMLSLSSVIAFIYWLMLYLNIPWMTNISGWFWPHVDESGIHGWRFVGLLLISLMVFGWILLGRLPPRFSLIILMIFGYFLMIGIGFIMGDNGIEMLRRVHITMNNQEIYSNFLSDHKIDPKLVLTNYEEIIPDSMFLKTKPPGPLFIYSVLQKVSEALFNPADNRTERQLRLTQLISVSFPFLTVLALPLLYIVARRFLNEQDALIPCILYLTAPNVLLMPVGLDKALHPALFLIGILLILRNSQLRTFSSSLLLGFYLYTALFFSFSLVPLLLWSPLWLLIDGYNQNRKDLFHRLIRPLLGVGIGFLISALIFGIILDYNIVGRYLNAMEWHRSANHFQLTIAFLWSAFIVNNVELASFSGFSLIIFAGIQIAVSVTSIFHPRKNNLDAFLFVFLIVYIFLNIFNQMRAEVARLWLFLVPVFTLAAGYFLSRTAFLRKAVILTLAALQLVTTYFLLAHQCPCWSMW